MRCIPSGENGGEPPLRLVIVFNFSSCAQAKVELGRRSSVHVLNSLYAVLPADFAIIDKKGNTIADKTKVKVVLSTSTSPQ